nr:uncharacterized protein LOC126054305 [Helicoverpa armigera]
MPHRCALGCKNTDVAVHVFPDPDKFPERFKAWVDIVRERLETPLDVEYFKKKRICDIHFIPEHRNRNKRLSALAIPILNLPGTSKSRETENSDDNLHSTSFAVADVTASDVLVPQNSENQCGDMQSSTSSIEATLISPDSLSLVLKKKNLLKGRSIISFIEIENLTYSSATLT